MAPAPGHVTAQSVPVLTEPGISLTAQPLPLPLDLLNQQVVFNVGLFIDWVTTGAALFQRQTQIPGSFVAAIGTGTPPPTAAAQALSAFADIEFEAGRDLIGFAQDIAVFQLQFRATTLSAFPPFNTGPGQQFVVDTTAFGLNVTQQMANFARAVITSVEQFTHNALHTPLPVTMTTAKPMAAADIPDIPVVPKTPVAPKKPAAQQDSIVSTFTPKRPKLPKQPEQVLDAAATDIDHPPVGQFSPPKASVPKFSAPKFSLPKFSLPKLSPPKIKGPSKD
ncbi:hypothetical protein [Mycobacterium sp. HM-7]